MANKRKREESARIEIRVEKTLKEDLEKVTDNLTEWINQAIKEKRENKISASEAVFGFCAWLTTRKTKTVMSSSDDASPVAQLIGAFCEENKLSEPRDNYTKFFEFPKNII